MVGMAHLEDPYDRYRVQFERIRREFRDPGPTGAESIELICDDLGEPGLAYQRGHLIIDAEPSNVGFVRDAFDAVPVGPAQHGRQLVSIGEREARGTLEEVRRVRGSRAAALNHLIAVAGDVNLCPADEPLGASGPLFPELAVGDDGKGVTIDVIDTGLVDGYLRHAWLDGVEGGMRYPIEGDIPLDYGHGTFVAGVLRCVAPGARVRVSNALRRAGAITEWHLARALAEIAESPDPPQIVSLSAGGTSEDGQTMLGLAPVVEALHRRGIVLVAAAGNHGNSTRFFPAAFDGVVSVGAIRRGGEGRACFSNHGDWVSVYAPGERLVNAFAVGSYATKHRGRETCRFRRRGDAGWYPCCTCVDTLDQGEVTRFTGLARWSGTSFATPIVAGMIAARLSAHGGTAREAADWLLRQAVPVPGVGRVVQPGQRPGDGGA